VKIGKAVLYPIEKLETWDWRNLAACDDGKVEVRRRRCVERPAETRSFR
jgi:hypothetical protein